MKFKTKDVVIVVALVIAVALAWAGAMKNDTASSGENINPQLTKTTSTMPETTENSQLKIEVQKEGSGASAQNGKKISVHYTGMLTDGKVFDSSIPSGKPFTLTLGAGQVIRGWDMGLLNMKVGEKRRLTIPPELAYGKNGFPPVIPPNATLVFDVELLSIN